MMPRGVRSKLARTRRLISSSVDLGGAEGLHQDRDGFGDADGVGELDLDFVGQARRDDVLGDEAGGVGGGAVHLAGVLAGERAAAVAGVAAVGVHDDLAARDARVGLRAADDEDAGGVDVVLDVVGDVLLVVGEDGLDDLLLDDAPARRAA